MMSDFAPIVVAILAFSAVAAAVFVIGRYLATQMQVQRRLPASAQGGEFATAQSTSSLQAFIARHFDEKRFGIDSTLRGKLRRDLVRAGFFRNDALNHYVFARLAAVIVLPTLAYVIILVFLPAAPWYLKLVVLLVSLLLAIVGPDGYISRCQRILAEKHRLVFPDFIDLLTVCVDAGLSLEAALDRVTGEIAKQNREFGLNLLMVAAETRAGRSTVDALEALADRLGLDEARSLVLVLRQSIELGSDISEALHVFSDEMRLKRLLRAEETANKLPVKMVLPMGLFIFPVILLVVLLPVMHKLATVVFK
jgi:tight adherence protein C